VNYDDFELELQILLDEDRLDDAGVLLDQVDAQDLAKCQQLVASYQVLFAGLRDLRSIEYPELQDSVAPQVATIESTRHSFPSAILAAAICLAVMAVLPWLSRQPLRTPVAASPSPVIVERAKEVATPAPPRFSPAQLASSFTQHTEGALQSFNQLATSLDPMKQAMGDYSEFNAYHEAVPLLGNIAQQLVPGTKSLGNAISAIQEPDSEEFDSLEAVENATPDIDIAVS